MQKNKFIHEDIKAVCNGATKKLVALGLVAVVGGACTIGCDTRLLASAQQDFDHVISDDRDTLITGDGKTVRYGNGKTEVHGHGATDVYGIGTTTMHGDGSVVMNGNGHLQMNGDGNAVLQTRGTVHTFNSYLTTVNSPNGVVSAQNAKKVYIKHAEKVDIKRAEHVNIQSVGPGSENVNSPNGVASGQNTTSAPRSYSDPDCVVAADRYKLVDISGACDVRLGRPSPMKRHKFSQNHPYAIINDNRAVQVEGPGPVWISNEGRPVMLEKVRYGWCRGDGDKPWYVYGKRPVVIPESASVKIDHRDNQVSDQQADIYVAYPQSNDQLRDVIVNRANSLTVAAEVPIRMQNHTEFRMGATAPETAENILRALSPNSFQNVLNRLTNQNQTDDEMKEERENHSTTSSQGGGFFSMINPFGWFGGWSGSK